MNLTISELQFALPNNPFGNLPKKIDVLAEQISSIEQAAGTGSKRFKQAYSLIKRSIIEGFDLSVMLDEPIKVRALAILLNESGIKDKINLTARVLRKIDELRPVPSILFVQSVFQHFLTFFERLDSPGVVAEWLKRTMKLRNMLKDFHELLLSMNGPHWLAQKCITAKREFSNQLQHFDLQKYAAGDFIKAAKRIYFVEQLKVIPVNKPHDLLQEVKNKYTFEGRYDEHHLVGHKVLQILLQRAPQSGVDESWLNVVLAIAGDPRVPESHPKYRKWWSRLDSGLRTKAEGWLSRLDLKLFLEALENFSYQSNDPELRRMYPSRKSFLEGLLDSKLILNTRLYLSSGATSYLNANYKKEHLPNYSRVTDGNKSIIYLALNGAHMIEGSHSCKLWLYKRLHPSAIVYNYNEREVTYRSLTLGLDEEMANKGTPSHDSITHLPQSFSWQRRAIASLNELGVRISPQQVLSSSDYQQYIRIHGR